MENWMEKIDYGKGTGVENKSQYHIQCKKGDIAPIAIVPGDQGRVKRIIKFLENPTKIAENRGLITYKGTYEGIPVSVTSTGMGGPAAGIVYEELINLGAKILIRIGSMAAIQPEINRGDISIPMACVRDDGLTQYYVPQNYPAIADPILYNNLIKEGEKSNIQIHTGINWTHSAFYSRSKDYFLQWTKKGVKTLEMEASALFVIGMLRGVSTAMIGTIYENRFNQTEKNDMDLSVKNIDDQLIEKGVNASIEIALKAAISTYKQKWRN
jgi:uridine phosphorylase